MTADLLRGFAALLQSFRGSADNRVREHLLALDLHEAYGWAAKHPGTLTEGCEE